MKAVMLAAGAALLVSGCMSTAPNDMGMARSSMAMPTNAMSYMQMAHSADMFEIESSRMALQMSRNASVRTFAQMMINDHTRMMNEMMGMAGTMNMNMNMSAMPMMPHHTAMLQRLRTASSSNFDMMYKREQVMGHQEAHMLHRTYAARGDNPALRAMAARAVPMIAAHLLSAQRLPTRM